MCGRGRGENFENFEDVGATAISDFSKNLPFDSAPIAWEALPQVSPWAVRVRDGRTRRPIEKLFETKFCMNTSNTTISTVRALSTRFANKAGLQHKKGPRMAKPPARLCSEGGSHRARNRRHTWGVCPRPTSTQISLLPFATCQVLPWCALRADEPCAEERRC